MPTSFPMPNQWGSSGVPLPLASADMNAKVDVPINDLYALVQPSLTPWTTFASAWRGTAAPTTATFGTGGSISGRYNLVGKTCSYIILMSTGSTTPTAPGGVYTFDLPLTANSAMFGVNTAVGTALLGANVGFCFLANGSAAQIRFHGTASSATAGVPVTWGANLTLFMQGTYEAA